MANFILGIDPGGTTGFCMWYADTDVYCFEQVEYDPVLLYNMVGRFTNWGDREVDLVIEDFDNRQDEGMDLGDGKRGRPKIDYTAPRVIGIVDFFVANGHAATVHKKVQKAATAKGGFWGKSQGGDDRIHRLGLWRPMKHSMDALRHVLYYRTFVLKDKTLLYKLGEKAKP